MRPFCRTVGVEVELLAPPGSSRRELAEHVACRLQGKVRAFFHLDAEPSKVSGKPVFHHLTQGFEILDARGQPVARCVDDITLQHDLEKSAAPREGWFRIVSDDTRLLRLIARHSHADAPMAESLQAAGQLFGMEPQLTQGGVYKLCDSSGASIALAAPLPGERERACELVTAPLPGDDRDTLPMLLDSARELGFMLPREGATHLHFDGEPFCSAAVLQALVNLLHGQRDTLRAEFQTNPHCRRLGPWPQSLLGAINAPDFAALPWDEARARLLQDKLTKYCDFNIRNLVLPLADKKTLEIRILPTTLNAESILRAWAGLQELFQMHLSPLLSRN